METILFRNKSSNVHYFVPIEVVFCTAVSTVAEVAMATLSRDIAADTADKGGVSC